ILSIPKKDLEKAKKRLEYIKPLLSLGDAVSLDDIKIEAVKVGVHHTTIYRWLKAYSATHSLVSLVPQKRGWRRRDSRIHETVDKIIEHGIDTYYLTKDRFPKQFVYLRIREACAKAGVTPPSRSTIFRRIAMVSEEKRLRARGHLDIANNRFAARAGKFPNEGSILSVVQTAHTPLASMRVADEQRESIKRVSLEMAIDVYSRRTTYCHLSLDPPTTSTVAMSLAH